MEIDPAFKKMEARGLSVYDRAGRRLGTFSSNAAAIGCVWRLSRGITSYTGPAKRTKADKRLELRINKLLTARQLEMDRFDLSVLIKNAQQANAARNNAGFAYAAQLKQPIFNRLQNKAAVQQQKVSGMAG